MSDLAPHPDLAARPPLSAESTLMEQWAAVEDSARVVAMLAGRPAPRQDDASDARIAQLARGPSNRSRDAVQALGELVATMRVGLDALLGAYVSAGDPQVAASRLWNEYERGRAKVLSEVATALTD